MSKPERLKRSPQRSRNHADKTPQRSTRQRAQAKAAASVTAPEQVKASAPMVSVPPTTSSMPVEAPLTREELHKKPVSIGLLVLVVIAVCSGAGFYIDAKVRESIHQVEEREIRPLREEVIRLRADAR